MLQPLELHRRVRPLDQRIEFIPLVDVLLIALIFFLMGSRFIMAPGVGFSVSAETPALPMATGTVSGVPTVDVLTVSNPEMCLFNGSFFSLEELSTALDSGRLTIHTDHTLLVRMNPSLDVASVFQVAEWASRAGYDSVQIAARAREGDAREEP